MTYWKLERPSKRSGKKWQVRVPTSSGRGKTVAFGDATAEDFTIHKDKARRDNYRTRHQHDLIDDPYAPGFWSWWSLWGESSNLKKAHAAAVKRAKQILGMTTNEEGEEVVTRESRRNPNPPGTPSPTMAEVAEVVAVLDVPKHLRAEFMQGFATEWEHAHTVGYDLVMVGSIVLDHLAEDAHYYRKLRRARLNPADHEDDTAPSNRVQSCFDALLSLVQEQYPSLSCTIEVDETAGERGGHACTRAYAFCEDLDDGSFRIAVAGKLDSADDSRVEGLLRHELAHAVLLHGGDLEHTERDADEVAEALFGSPLYYDEDDVQTTDQSAPGARRPRPAYLDDEQGRTRDAPTLDEAQPNPYPAGTMHQLHTVEDVASCLDDCAAQGDAKTPRMLASQFSQQSKEVAGAQARMLLTLAKAARHCAGAIEARLAGEVDRAMVGERMCESALAEAQSPGRMNPHDLRTPVEKAFGLQAGEAYGAGEYEDTDLGHAKILGHKVEFSQDEATSRITGWVKGIGTVGGGYSLDEAKEAARQKLAALRKNPEWAKKLGSGLYKGARYSAETARDLYVGAREAHAAHGAEAPRANPTCPKCGGTGKLSAFRHVEQGTCFRCGGTGEVDKLTPAEKGQAAPPPPTGSYGVWIDSEDYNTILSGYSSFEEANKQRRELAKEHKDATYTVVKFDGKVWRTRSGERATLRPLGGERNRNNPDYFDREPMRLVSTKVASARLPGIGRLTITPDPGTRDRASVEVTKAFADEWDHGEGRSYLMQDVMDAAEKHRGDSNFYAVALKYKGREFFKAYPRGAGV